MLQPATIGVPLINYRESTFLDERIPPVVFNALRYHLAMDSGSQLAPLRCLAATFFENLITELEKPSSPLLAALTISCIQFAASSRGCFNDAPKLLDQFIPQEILTRVQFIHSKWYYGDLDVSVPPFEKQLKNFQRDITTHLREILTTKLQDDRCFDAAHQELILQGAALVNDYFKRVANDKRSILQQPKIAAVLADLIIGAPTNREIVARYCASLPILFGKNNPAEIIAKRIPPAHTELATYVASLKPSNPAALLSSLKADERELLVNELAITLRTQARTFEYQNVLPFALQTESELRENRYRLPPQAPEWIRGLVCNRRLFSDEANHFLLAEAELAKQIGKRPAVSVDLSLFSWPRLTEIAALTHATRITIHSDLPSTNTASEVPPRRIIETLATRESLALPWMAIARSASKVVELEKAWLQTAEIRTEQSDTFSYESSEGVRQASLVYRSDACVADRVSALLGGKRISTPCFIIEGQDPLQPRAFGVLFDVVERQRPGFNQISFGRVHLFVNQDERIRNTPSPASASDQSSKALLPPKPLPPAQPPQVAISEELKRRAAEAITTTERYVLSQDQRVKSTLQLMSRIAKGQCPSRKELRVRIAMEYAVQHGEVTGGVYALYEKAVPIMSEIADLCDAAQSS